MTALQLVSGISSTRKSQEKDAAAKQQIPMLLADLERNLAAGNNPASNTALLRLRQLGVEVPVGYLEWARPKRTFIQSDLGGQQAIVAGDPVNGKTNIAALFNKSVDPNTVYKQNTVPASTRFTQSQINQREQFRDSNRESPEEKAAKSRQVAYSTKQGMSDAQMVDEYNAIMKDPERVKKLDGDREAQVQFNEATARYNNYMNSKTLTDDEYEFLSKKGLRDKEAWTALQYYRGNKLRGIANN